MQEEWRDVEGYEGLYQVSNLGRVKNVKYDRMLTGSRNTWGYLGVNLCKNGIGKKISIHLLVIRAFVGRAPIDRNGISYDCHHKDGDKRNNKLSNLEYVTKSENIAHSHTIPGRKPRGFTQELWEDIKSQWAEKGYAEIRPRTPKFT